MDSGIVHQRSWINEVKFVYSTLYEIACILWQKKNCVPVLNVKY